MVRALRSRNVRSQLRRSGGASSSFPAVGPPNTKPSPEAHILKRGSANHPRVAPDVTPLDRPHARARCTRGRLHSRTRMPTAGSDTDAIPTAADDTSVPPSPPPAGRPLLTRRAPLDQRPLGPGRGNIAAKRRLAKPAAAQTIEAHRAHVVCAPHTPHKTPPAETKEVDAHTGERACERPIQSRAYSCHMERDRERGGRC